MRILFLTHYFPPEVNAPASRTYEHCKRWASKGYDVTVVTCAPNAPDGQLYSGYKNKLFSKEIIDGIKVVRVWTYIAPNSGFFKRILNFVTYMFSALNYVVFSFIKFDRVVATSPQFFVGWTGVLIKWFRRKPFILEIRDIWPESIIAVGAMKKSLIIRFLEIMEKKMYRAADHIVTVGKGYTDNIVRKGISKDKVSEVMNGVSLDLFNGHGNRIETREKYSSNNKFICSYIGTVGMAHGLDVLIRAAALLINSNKDIEFWIVGDGAKKNELEDMAKKQKLTNVKFLGKLPKEEMPNVIAASDAGLVHLRKTELFSTVIPSKIFEFMAMELPIIMGVNGEAKSIVLEAKAGEVMEPGSEESLLSSINKIIYNGRSQYNGLEFVKKNYNRDDLASKMLSLIVSTNNIKRGI